MVYGTLTVRSIFGQFDFLGIGDVIEGGPSGARVVFGLGLEQILAADQAAVHTVGFQFVVFIGERPVPRQK